jgi:diguanylate cyclase (GGDEF)-like protein/PAS domain S-box-containing protein
MTRRLLLAATILPPILGWFAWAGQRLGFYGTDFGIILLVIMMSGIVIALTVWATGSIDRRDAAHKRAKEALQKNEAQLQALSDASPLGIFITDTKGNCTYTNPCCLQISGLTFKTIFEGEWLQALHPDDRKRVSSEWHSSVQNQTPFESEHRFLRKDGNTVWTRVKAEPIRDGRTITGYAGTLEDITRRKQVEEALRASEDRARLIIDTAYDAFIAIDAGGLIIEWNSESERTFGWSRKEALGRSLADTIIPPQHRDAHRQGLNYFQRSGTGPLLNKRVEFTALHRDSREFPVELTISPVRRGETYTFNAFVRDITERKRSEAQLKEIGFHDPLTGLPNRSLCLDRLNQAMSRTRWHKRLVAVLFLDLDRFKVINDTLGHNVGDQLLKAVAKRLATCLRDGDTASRFGGDEFVIILADIAQAQDVPKIAQKVLDVFSKPILLDRQEVTVAISIGISLFPNDGGFPETLLKKADAAMYRAKKQGGSIFLFYTSNMAGP